MKVSDKIRHAFDNKSVAFGRNETFLLRYNWIFKGLSSIKKFRNLSSPDALNELGVEEYDALDALLAFCLSISRKSK